MALPPLLVTQKTVKENCFSKHDNRHAFQSSGVYFGQGLGKRLVSRAKSQHSSENHTSWSTCDPGLNTESTYITDYHHEKKPSTLETPSEHLPKLSHLGNTSLTHKFHVFSKPTFHRFPRAHTALHILPPAPPLSKRAEWFPHDHCSDGDDVKTTVTPLVVLAESQKPFLSHNPWVYSYRS